MYVIVRYAAKRSAEDTIRYLRCGTYGHGGNREMQCEKCLLSRQVVSENGFHPVCCLPEDEARECILGEASHFTDRPTVIEIRSKKKTTPRWTP